MEKPEGKYAYFSKNNIFPIEVNEKILSYLPENIYKLFYKFNRNYKCIFENFMETSNEKDFNNRFLNVKLKSIKYFYNLESEHKNIDLSSVDTTKWKLQTLIDNINKKNKLNLSKKINNFYISGNKETLYIIEDECLRKFNILNKNILNMIDKLPFISNNTGNITLNNNISNVNSTITNVNTNNYTCSNDVQIFKFNGNDYNIDFYEKNKDTEFILDGNIEDWYYYIYNTNITQLIYITLEDSKKFNKYFLRYKTSFKIDLQRVYKIIYKNNDDHNSNRGFKCIYKDIFEITEEHKLMKLLINKNIKIYYCKTYNKIFNYNLTKDFKENMKIVFSNYNPDYLNQVFDYNKLYISEDETILYYIEDNYIDNFNVLNRNIIDVLNNMPNIEYSKEISIKNKSYYYTINLNNDLLADEINNDLLFLHGNFICKNNIQLFIFKNNEINKKEIKADTIFKLEDDIHNWYFISTTLKKQLHISLPLQIENLNNNKETILQLIYITPEMINKYKQMFINFKIPITFQIKNKIKSRVSTNYPSIKASTGGENKSISRRLLKSYYL